MSRRTQRASLHVAALAAALLAFYAMLGFILLPHLLERKLFEYAERAGIALSVGALQFNPFTMTLEGRDVHAARPGSGIDVRVARFALDFDSAGALERTWAISLAEVNGAQALLRLDAGGVPHGQAAAENTRADRLPPLRLERIRITDAHLELSRGSGTKAHRYAIGPLRMQAEGLGTRGERGPFLLTANLPQEGDLATAGALALQPFALGGSIEARELHLESLAPFAMRGTPIPPPVGRLDFEFDYRFGHGNGSAAATLRGLRAQLADFALRASAEDAPMIALSTVTLAGGDIDLAARSATLQALHVDGARVAVVREADGRLDISRAARAFAAQPAPGEDLAHPWQVEVVSMALNAIGARYVDRAHSRPPSMPARLEAGAIRVRMGVAATIGSPSTHVAVSALALELRDLVAGEPDTPLARIGSVAIDEGRLDTHLRSIAAAAMRLESVAGGVTRERDGTLRLTGSTATVAAAHRPAAAARAQRGSSASQPWSVQVGRLEASGGGLHFLDRSYPAPLRLAVAKAAFVSKVELTAASETDVLLTAIEASLSGIRAHGAARKAGVALEQLALGGGSLDSGKRRLAAQRVLLRGGSIALVRDTRGSVQIEGLPPLAAAPQASRPASGAAPWHYDIAMAQAAGIRVAIADRSFAPGLAYRLVVDASVQGLRDEGAAPLRYDATLAAIQGGTLRIQGTASQDFKHASARLAAQALALRAFDPLLARYAHLQLVSGSATADLRAQYRAGAGAPMLVLEGGADLAEVLVNDTRSGEPFAAWKSLAARRIRVSLSPNRLDIGEIHVTGPQAKITVSEKRTLNLARVLKTQAHGGVERPDADEPALPVRIGRLRVADGAMQFADLSLVLPFSTRIHAIEGVIVGLSSAPDARAELELDGRIEEYGSARARGSLNAANPTEFMDIAVAFDNVRIPPLSPYTATFAGRMIESGRLWLDLDYRIIGGKLSGENKIVLRDVKLGERVKTPTASDLPLELALALLEDSQGRVTLEIPVSGNVGDPEFDYGKVIRSAIGRTLQRIVTAPFRALAALFGGRDAEVVRKVEFEPGSHALAPSEQEQLALLAKALAERPALELIVSGPYDAALDGRALRAQAVRAKIAAALGRAPLPGAGADPIAFSDPDTQRVLAQLSAAQRGAVPEPEPRGTRADGERKHYASLFAELVDREPLSETQLKLLAAERAKAVSAQLVQAGLDAERIAGSRIEAASAEQPGTVVAMLDLRPSRQ